MTDQSTFNLEIESESKYLEPLREKLKSFLEGRGFSTKSLESIMVAMGEACTNSMRHSYGNVPGKKIEVSAQDFGDKVTFKIRDYGQTIDLTKVKEPTLPPQKGGGLGLYFMREIMDEMEHNTSLPEGNELILTKFKDKGEN